MMPAAKPATGPAAGSAWRSSWPGSPRPLAAGHLNLADLPTTPFWARRYTRWFLDACKDVPTQTIETAELVVSELVTNAVRFSGDPTRTVRYTELEGAAIITLSLRHFPDGLLVEVFDSDANPPVLVEADAYAEGGRGLMLIDAMSKEWSYFRPPTGGKVVYCLVEIPPYVG